MEKPWKTTKLIQCGKNVRCFKTPETAATFEEMASAGRLNEFGCLIEFVKNYREAFHKRYVIWV